MGVVVVLTLLTLFTALRRKKRDFNQNMSAIRRTARAPGRVFHRVDLRLREKSERKMIPAVTGNGSSFHSCLKPYRDANDAG